MSELDKVNSALREWKAAPGEHHILSNLCHEIASKDAFFKVWTEIRPFPDELYEYPDLPISILRGCVKSGMKIDWPDFYYVEEWISSGLESKIEIGRSSLCVELAMLFTGVANDFSENSEENNRFSDPNQAMNWINRAVDVAETVDQCLYIIDSVATPFQGLHTNDKLWGTELVERMLPKFDEKKAKKLKEKAKKVLGKK